MTAQTKKWFKGLAATAIATACNAGNGMLALPTIFNFSHDGLLNTFKLIALPTMAAVFAYLSKSPLSDVTATIDAKGNVTDVEGSVTVGVTSTKN